MKRIMAGLSRAFVVLGLLCLLCLSALLSVACSKSSGRAVPAPADLTLAYAEIPDASLVQVALAQGFFAAEGLRIHDKPFAFGKPALDAVIGGEADVATVAETPLVFAILGGARVQIAAVIGTSDRNAAIVAKRSAGIASAGDIAGKSIGVTRGTTGEYFLNCFLVSRGIEEKDVRVIDLKPEGMTAALAAGRVDAVATWNPTLSQIAATLAGDGIMLYGEAIYTENFCIAVDQDFIRKNPGRMKAFMRALLRAEDFIGKDPAKAISASATYDHIDEAGLAAAFGLFRFRLLLDQSLLLILEDESRWALGRLADARKNPPNYLDYLADDALSSVAPERVRLIR